MYTKHLAPAREFTVLRRTIVQLNLKGLLHDREGTRGKTERNHPANRKFMDPLLDA